MKRKKITIQIIQNGIIILNNKEIKQYKINSVDNYRIINKDNFINEMTNIFKKQKINQTIITNDIDIIVDNTYSEIDKEVLLNIFKELSFNNINYIEITEIFNIKKDEIIIDISTNNIKIYYLNEVIEQKVYFYKYNQYINLLLKNILELKQIKTIKLFGNRCNDKKIIKTIEKITNAEVYIYSQPSIVPIYLLT
jgi:hypothetical protein